MLVCTPSNYHREVAVRIVIGLLRPQIMLKKYKSMCRVEGMFGIVFFLRYAIYVDA
jgi:hypothetical protein